MRCSGGVWWWSVVCNVVVDCCVEFDGAVWHACSMLWSGVQYSV